jgi:hypothetical protein
VRDDDDIPEMREEDESIKFVGGKVINESLKSSFINLKLLPLSTVFISAP